MSNIAAIFRRRRRTNTNYTPEATYFEWTTSPTQIVLNAIGATATVVAKVTDQRHRAMATQPTITYSSATTAKITVSGAVLTAVANGTSVITASAATGGWTDITGTATVAQVVASASISPSSTTLAPAATQQYTLTAKDRLGVTITSPPAPTWYANSNLTGDPWGTITSGGLFTANGGADGDTSGYIHAQYPNGVNSQFADVTQSGFVQTLDHLTMVPSSSTVVETDTAPTLTLGQWQTGDESTPYTDTLSPANAFTSGNTSVATIGATSGVITLQGPGTTTITRTAGGETVSFTLTVTSAATVSIASTPSSLLGVVGGTSAALFIANQLGANVTSGCTFATSNVAVATVDSDGVVTYVAEGDAEITVEHTASGATCTVGVTVTSVNQLWFDESAFIGSIGGAHQTTVKYGADYATGTDVTDDVAFASDDTGVAVVDPPTLTGAPTPATIQQGTGPISYSFPSTNPRSIQALAGLPTGVTASAATVVDSTHISFDLTATGSATLGDASVYLIDTDHGNSGTEALGVVASGINLVGTPVRNALNTSSFAALAAPSFAAVAGNMIVVAIRGNSGGGSPTPSITDTAGNTYTLIGSIAKTTANFYVHLYYAKNCLGNAVNVVTFTDINSAYKALAVIQLSGASTTVPLDKNVTAAANGAGSVTSPSYTTTAAVEFILAVAHADASNVNTPTGFTAAFTAGTLPALFYKSVSSIQTGATTTVTSAGGTDNITMKLATIK